MNTSTNGPWQGQAPKLSDAIDDAWAKAKDHGRGPGLYTVEKIQVVTANPIVSYIVEIGPV